LIKNLRYAGDARIRYLQDTTLREDFSAYLFVQRD